MSQKQRVLARLQQGECSNMEFVYELGLPRYNARIHELNQTHIRAFGRELIKKRHGNKPNIWIWYLADKVASEKLVSITPSLDSLTDDGELRESVEQMSSL